MPDASSGRKCSGIRLGQEAVRTTPPSMQYSWPQGEEEGLGSLSGKPCCPPAAAAAVHCVRPSGRASASWRRTGSSQRYGHSCVLRLPDTPPFAGLERGTFTHSTAMSSHLHTWHADSGLPAHTGSHLHTHRSTHPYSCLGMHTCRLNPSPPAGQFLESRYPGSEEPPGLMGRPVTEPSRDES